MTAHTPGPWHTERAYYVGADDNEYSIIGMTDCGRPDFYSEPVSVRVADAYTEPDARLIAAAPELLGALQGIIRNAGYESGEAPPSLNDLRVSIRYLDAARAAIAKATGGSI